MNALRLFVCWFLIAASAFAQSKEPYADITGVFSLRVGVAAYDLQDRRLKFFERRGGMLRESKSISVEHTVWAIEDVEDGYIVASGYGRGTLDAPLRLTWFSKDGSASRIVYEKAGERSQASHLERVGGDLWMTFFDSKYVTKTGVFTISDTLPWTFTERMSQRLGDAVDVFGEAFAIGRPYGDKQGQDGDLTLHLPNKTYVIPTYRGVRAVRLFGNPTAPDVLVADGWHQNYGQFAQARLTLAKLDAATDRYASQLISLDPGQYGFSKLIEFKIGTKSYMAALGNKTLQIYSPLAGWSKKVVFTRVSEEHIFDVALLEVDGVRATFLVANKGLNLITYP